MVYHVQSFAFIHIVKLIKDKLTTVINTYRLVAIDNR